MINALSADEHPTQALADLKHCWSTSAASRDSTGNSTAAALALATSRISGARLTLATPPGYGLDSAKLAAAQSLATVRGATIAQVHDIDTAPTGVDVVYTSRWQEMGVSKADLKWREAFAPFQVTQRLMDRVAGPRTVFMHDLPAVRGEDVDDDVLDGPRSLAGYRRSTSCSAPCPSWNGARPARRATTTEAGRRCLKLRRRSRHRFARDQRSTGIRRASVTPPNWGTAMSDKFEDACGLFGVCGHPDAVALTVSGLSALQHRGQESAGIAFHRAGSADIECIKVMGTVQDLLPRVRAIQATAAVGHVRYGTCGESTLSNAQPFVTVGPRGRVALCHNGHVVELDRLRATMRPDDAATVANDSEMLARRVAMHFTADIIRAIQNAFEDVTPAFSVLVLTADSMCAVRDALGMRPLSVGRKEAATVISSETCALDTIGARHLRDVGAGEIVRVQGEELQSASCGAPRQATAHCIFELIYFARPDSVVFGHSVAEFRMRLGARLALESPIPADVVVPVPDSAVYGGLGYAHASGIEFTMALFRNPFVGRSFIEPTPAARSAAVHAKLNPISALISGRRVILIDDSIVRGNTCRHLARRMREAGAREVHVRVTSPPVIASCHFGVDTPDDRELFAHRRDVGDMRSALGVDSLEFLSLEGLHATVASGQGFCDGCFSRTYPVDVPHIQPVGAPLHFDAKRTQFK